MAATITIISGFLGAGKTTLIQTLIGLGAFPGKVAIVENDFGEVSLDAALLRQGAVTVSELNSGCICCSLSGDFIRALEELVARYQPDTILIEPSGVAKLTDILSACAHPRLQSIAHVQSAITVVDVKRVRLFLDNFGAFYEDQVKRADIIVLSRVERYPDLVSDALERIIALNSRANIVALPFSELTADQLFLSAQAEPKKRIVIGHRAARTEQPAPSHAAEDTFQTVTIHTQRSFLPEELHALLQRAEIASGLLVRAKGILKGAAGSILVQYTLGETIIEETEAEGDFLCLIGQGLDASALNSLFLEE